MWQHVWEFCGYPDTVIPLPSSLKNRFLYFPFPLFTKAQRWQCCFETQNQCQHVTNVDRQMLQSNLFNKPFPQWAPLKQSPPCHHFSAVACRLHGAHAPWEELNPSFCDWKRHGLESRRQEILSWRPWVQSLWSKCWKTALSEWLMAGNSDAGARERLVWQDCATWIHNTVEVPSTSEAFLDSVTVNFSFSSHLVSNPGTLNHKIPQFKMAL